MWEHRTNPGNPLSPAAWNGSSRRQRTSSGFPSPIPLECENLPFVSQDVEGLNKQNKSGGHLVRTTATLFFSAANFRLPFVLFLLHAAGRHPKLQLLKRLLTSHSFDVFFLRSVFALPLILPQSKPHTVRVQPLITTTRHKSLTRALATQDFATHGPTVRLYLAKLSSHSIAIRSYR